MTDAKDTGGKDAGTGGPRPLTLKRSVETGQVRQSFSHGRSKAVVVEVKRKRHADAPAAKPAAPAAAPARPAAAATPAPTAVQPAAEAKAPAARAPEAESPMKPAVQIVRPAYAPPPKAPEKPAPAAAPAVEAPAVEAPVAAAPPAKEAAPRAAAPRAAAPAKEAAAPRAAAPRTAAPSRAAAPRAESPAQGRSAAGARSRVVLPTLTEEEKIARTRALEGSKVIDSEARKRAEIEAARRQIDEQRLADERAAAARRLADEEARKRNDEEAKRKAEEEANRRLQEAGRARPGVPGTPGVGIVVPPLVDEEEEERARKKKAGVTPKVVSGLRKGEPKRRGKQIDVARALDDEERQRSLASFRRAREREKRLQHVQERTKVMREVTIPDVITVGELANRMAERAVDVIRTLMGMGVMATINHALDADTAQLVVEEMGHTVKRVSETDVEIGLKGEDDKDTERVPRAPVVTVMGHVDHGKTSLLDSLRATDVAAGEAGGITQHIGAYRVTTPAGHQITFLDTPGHEAFTAMRARGAKATDIVVLVVAADDGVMPQTAEAINHAKAANVPIIVAINKCDKPSANPAKVRQELLQYGIVTEDMGGDVLSIEVSATKKLNLDKLEEAIHLQAEILDLRANPERVAEGVVVEAKLDRGRGPVATVLVQRGTLKVGDILVAGAEYGRVRALVDDHGRQVKEAGPSMPVEILGLQAAPEAGDEFAVVPDENKAREISEFRQRKRKEALAVISRGAGGTLDQMLSKLKEGETKEMPVVVKSDVQGSSEAIVAALTKMSTDEVKVRVLAAGVGGITESDVTLAKASTAMIIAFNVRASKQARDLAQRDGVDIRYYSIIYNLVDDVRAVMTGMLKPQFKEIFRGYAEIKEVFAISKVGKVAGCLVTDGSVRRGNKVRIIRDNVVIHEGTLSSLKRFKDEVKEVISGTECGMAFENYQDIRPGDVVENFEVEEIARVL